MGSMEGADGGAALLVEDGDVPATEKDKKAEDQVKLKKELGLLEGVAIILGIIIGSGESLMTGFS